MSGDVLFMTGDVLFMGSPPLFMSSHRLLMSSQPMFMVGDCPIMSGDRMLMELCGVRQGFEAFVKCHSGMTRMYLILPHRVLPFTYAGGVARPAGTRERS